MKSEYEQLKEKIGDITRRKRETSAIIADAERLEAEANAKMEEAVAAGEDVTKIRQARSAARKEADEARELVELIEAGRVAALRPYAQAVLDAAPEKIAQVQADYDASIEAVKLAYGAYRQALTIPRGIEQGSRWIAEAYSAARTITGSHVGIGVRFTNIDRKEAEGWK